MSSPARAVVDRFLAAVEARDPDAVSACFTEDAVYRNMPHEPAVGREAIRALFARAVARSDRVQWDIVSSSESADTVWLERIDRFWIDGQEYAIECNGVWEVDNDASLIREVRDYLDLGVWIERSSAVIPRDD